MGQHASVAQCIGGACPKATAIGAPMRHRITHSGQSVPVPFIQLANDACYAAHAEFKPPILLVSPRIRVGPAALPLQLSLRRTMFAASLILPWPGVAHALSR